MKRPFITNIFILLIISGIGNTTSTAIGQMPNQIPFTAEEQAEIGKFCAVFGNDVKAVDKEGLTLLHKAAALGKIEIVKILVYYGANIYAKSNNGATPFDIAKTLGNTTITEYFYSISATFPPPTGQQITGNQTPPAAANPAIADQAAVDRFLAANSSSMQNGNTLLHKAAELGRLDIIKFAILETPIDTRNYSYGRTPLHIAAQKGQTEAVKLLVANGANINIKDDQRWGSNTPLHLAASSGQVEAVKTLVSLGANILVKDRDGKLPINSAKDNGHSAVVAYLNNARSEKPANSFKLF